MFRLHRDPAQHLITGDEPFLPRHVGQVGQIKARPEKQVTEPPDGQTLVSLLAETWPTARSLVGACFKASTRSAGTPASASRCSPRRAARARDRSDPGVAAQMRLEKAQ
jgi:hypothetical protein